MKLSTLENSTRPELLNLQVLLIVEQP